MKIKKRKAATSNSYEFKAHKIHDWIIKWELDLISSKKLLKKIKEILLGELK